MKHLDRITELIEQEIKPLTMKQDISPQELKNLGEAVDILKDVETIKAMKEADYGGEYSNRGNSYGSYDGQSNRGNRGYGSYDGMQSNANPNMNMGGQSMNSYGQSMAYNSMMGQSNNSYEGQSMEGQSMARRGRDGDGDGRYSERRGRDRMGRYTSRDGYSGHSEREYMIDRLEDMVDDARSERERRIIERCIDKLSR